MEGGREGGREGGNPFLLFPEPKPKWDELFHQDSLSVMLLVHQSEKAHSSKPFLD
jgi:hypothetical protein